MNYAEKITKRQESNLKILERLKDMVESHPELRFTQILWAAGIFRRTDGVIEDTFYEESVDTLEKLK